MATEKRLIPDGEKVTLDELLPGTIFAFGGLTFASGNAGYDCIAVKSEYRCSNGLIEAFIIDSGEQFWGGAKTAREQNELMVQPLAIVEVVHGRWIHHSRRSWGLWEQSFYECSICGSRNPLFNFNYCPNCGAKMDGDGNG